MEKPLEPLEKPLAMAKVYTAIVENSEMRAQNRESLRLLIFVFEVWENVELVIDPDLRREGILQDLEVGLQSRLDPN